MIKAYLEGKLDYEIMYRLEKQALDDPCLWEALEGYSQTSNSGTELSILQRQLHERIVHLQENKKVFHFIWQRLSVAASVSVLCITAGILFWMNIYRPGSTAERQVHVSLIIDRDSLKTEIQGSQNRPVIKEKEYPTSSEETIISAYRSPAVINQQPEENTASTSANPEITSAGTKIQSAKLLLEGRGTESKALASSAGIGISEDGVQPVPGWDIYRKYLKDNIRIPALEPKVSGSVLLYFEINEIGKPTNFQILKGLTEDCNNEAIRLIKDGPVWKTSVRNKINGGRIEVRF